MNDAINKASNSITLLATGAERDSAVKQNESLSRDVTQLREAHATVQQQLTAETLGRQSESEKALKVWQSAAGIPHCQICIATVMSNVKGLCPIEWYPMLTPASFYIDPTHSRW